MSRIYSLIIMAVLVICSIVFLSWHAKNANNSPDKDITAAETTAEETTAALMTEAETTAESEPETEPATEPATEPDTVPVTEPENGGEYIGREYTRAELEALDNTKNGYGQGLSVDENNRPWGAVNAQNAYGDYGAAFIAPNDGNIYLTFDLGYENGYTGQILDVLASKGVHAVFFATMSYCRQSPEIVERIINEGHTLGNHSVNHLSMPTLSVDDMVSEIMGMHEYIKNTYGYEMHLFRPPMGEYSYRSLAVAQSLGYKTVNWSFAYYDYDTSNQPEHAAALERVTGAAHGGAIYLLHAVSKTNTEILGEAIDAFRAKGYTLSAFS